MRRYLLDTDVLIDFSKGIPSVTAQLFDLIDGADLVSVCAVSVSEFFAGLTPDQAKQAVPFLVSLTYWDISRDAAMRAGQDRFALSRVGTTISITDSLLAAVAREYQATLVTSNFKHFPMDDLELLSLR